MQGFGQRLSEPALQGKEGGEQGRGIGLGHRLLQFRQPRQGQQGGTTHFGKGGVGQDAAEGFDQFLLQAIVCLAAGTGQGRIAQQLLAGIPAGEGIAIGGKEVHQLADRTADLQAHRC